MKQTEQNILQAIAANPLASQQELAEQLGLSRESVAGYISRLTRKGAILGKGYILPQQHSMVVIGGANVDLAGQSERSFQPGDSNPGAVQQSAGGVGRNIAENLARLGTETALITLVGKDSRGRFLLDQAAEAGITTHDIMQHPDLATSTYLALFNPHGELVGAVADMAIVDQLTPEILASKLPRLHSAGTIVVDANLAEATLAWLADQPLVAPIAADAVSVSKATRLIPLLPKLDVLKVNRAEAKAILGHAADSDISIETLLRELHARGVNEIILSLSQDGAILSTATTTVQRSVPTCTVISDTGAGDALLAGYLHARQQHDSLNARITFAMACAATTLEAAQAVHSSLSERFVTERFNDYIQQYTLADVTA